MGYDPTFQQIIITGRVAKKPSFKYLPNAKAVVNFALIVNRKGRNGADYIPCVAWAEKAKLVADMCDKGTLLEVQGELRSHTFKDNEQRDQFELQLELSPFGIFNVHSRNQGEEKAE
ncbi:single-stranded DNA-binding protein [Terribacillus saccharophilus]|uniref:single-stranded DNA-binding protein n=1 Tax=Terribacillus saccharophilus TaxID=361277 RepID=UPI0029899F67|nr:single-stranded DNA-binding protein [Terribacillus saccharophilus]MCM3227576.1 single-stranded DNA-binding protein [Terribacillus saccharophilus]